MSTPLKRVRWGLVVSATAVVAGLALAGHGWGGIAEAQTVPTATPWPPPSSTVGTIELCAVAPPANAWVEVQWEDALEGWHTVPVWSGLLLPMVPPDQPGAVCTIRWVVPDDFGAGPFRWVVYDSHGGATWGITDQFYFPTYAGEWVLTHAVAQSPATGPVSGRSGPTAGGGSCKGVHVVQAGENVFRIAYNCNLTIASLARANGLYFPYTIYPGEVLRYP